MVSYEIDAIKMEKSKAMHRYRTFQKITAIVRTLEIFVFVVLISWSIFRSSECLSTAIDASIAFLRRSSSLFFCPHFVFLLGNAIVITLFANSRQREKLSSADSISSVKSSCEFPVEIREPETSNVAVGVPDPEPKTAVIPATPPEIRDEETKSYRRTQLAVQKVVIREQSEIQEKPKVELQRSKTVPRRKSIIGESAMAEGGRRRRRSMYDVEDLSNEEFRRRVEAFIEKHQRFLMEESKSVVLNN